MSFRILMLDVDGVLVHRPDGRRWDADMQADLGLSPDVLQREFFARHWQDIVHGKARLMDRLTPVLTAAAPHLSAQALVDYWFAKDSNLDDVLLAELAALRAKGVPMHLATIQDHSRADYLWTTLGFSDRFDSCLHSAALGVSKPDPAYFAEAARRVGAAPADLMLIDDSAGNVEAARACGWQARVWTGKQRLAEVLAG